MTRKRAASGAEPLRPKKAEGRVTQAGKAKQSGKAPSRAALAAAEPPRRGRPRKVDADARRQAILDAALAVFAEHGFEAARLDDVAARSGVAKGTLYLYFRHKEALFEELVRSSVRPIIDALGALATDPKVPVAVALDAFFAAFQREVLGTRRKLLLRLVLAEGPRFPAIAEFYHREVVTRGLGLMRALAERGVRTGELSSEALVRFPHLVVAPLILSVIWDGMFARMDPLDVGGLLRAHRELLCRVPKRDTK